MEQLPLMLEGKRIGTLSVSRDGLYVCFRGEYHTSAREVLRLCAVGEEGELRLGIPEPRNGVFCLKRRVPAREAEPLGRLLRGELRRREAEDGWQKAPPDLFSGEELRRCLLSGEALWRRRDAHRCLALPFDCRQPFPLAEMFCFARICTIAGRQYAVFAFDDREQPVFF